MNYKQIVLNTMLTGLLLVSSQAFSLPYYFDSDNEGWQQTFAGRPPGSTYDTLFTNTGADWRATNGHPDGNIFQTAQGVDQRAYWMGNIGNNSLGDLTGMSLQTDIFSTGNWQTLADGSGGDDGNVYARWVIASNVGDINNDGYDEYNMYISTRDNSIDINGLQGWETRSITLDANNFFRWPNADAGTQNFDQVLTQYTSIGLYIFSGTDLISNINGGAGTWANSQLLHYGAYSNDNNDAVWALDNFRAVSVAEPFTALLFGLGIVGIAGFRHKQ